jgi:hypothetical protein
MSLFLYYIISFSLFYLVRVHIHTILYMLTATCMCRPYVNYPWFVAEDLGCNIGMRDFMYFIENIDTSQISRFLADC